jgi:hypothetical protein
MKKSLLFIKDKPKLVLRRLIDNTNKEKEKKQQITNTAMKRRIILKLIQISRGE